VVVDFVVIAPEKPRCNVGALSTATAVIACSRAVGSD
jgi:hypothetical protein